MEFDFWTYGGFDIIVKAFSAVALVMSDDSFDILYWSFAIIGLLSVFLGSYLVGLISGGMKLGPIEWAKSYWLAIFFYFLLVSPTGTLHVYDAHDNRYQAVGGLPMGVVVVAGITNYVERGMIEIVDTAMSPLVPYSEDGGGRGFDMLSKLYKYVDEGMKFKNEYDRISLDRYMQDCLLFHMVSGKISAESFKKDTDFMNNSLSTAQSPAIFTIFYSDANQDARLGVTMTCTDAYQRLKNNVFIAGYFDDLFEQGFCPSMGYKTDNPQSIAACRETWLKTLAQYVGSSGGDTGQALFQMYVSRYINDIVLDSSPAEAAEFVGSRQVGTGMAGVGIMANEFIPIFREVVKAIVIAFVPLIFLFMSTFAMEAFMYFLGMFIWLTIWGVADAILYNFAQDYAYTTFERIRQGEISYMSIFLFDTYSSKVLGVMGYMRVLGIMLSSSMAFGIMKFGGEAFARASGSIQGKVEGTGDVAGNTALQPEGKAEYMDRADKGFGRGFAQRQFEPWDRQASSAVDASSSYRSGVATSDILGGGNPVAAGMRKGEAGAIEGAIGTVATEKGVGIAGKSGYMEGISSANAYSRLTDSVKTNTLVNEGMKSTGLGEKGFVEVFGRMAGHGELGGFKAIYDTATANEMGKAYGGTANDVANFQRSLNASSNMKDLQDRIADVGAPPGVKNMAESLGVFGEGASVEGIKEKFNDEKLKYAEKAREGMSEFQKLEEYGAFTQSALAASKTLGLVKDRDGDGKVDDFERGYGLLQFHEGRRAANEVTLGKESAEHLTNTTGVKHNAGDRLNWAHDPDSGRITTERATGGMSRFEKDGEHVETQMSGKELKALASETRNNGHHAFAGYLDYLAGNRLKPNETAAVKTQRGNDGSLAMTAVEHGGKANHYDFAKRQWGTELDDWQGVATRDGNKYELTGGSLTQVGAGSNAFLSYNGMVTGPDGETYAASAKMDSSCNIKDIVMKDKETVEKGREDTTKDNVRDERLREKTDFEHVKTGRLVEDIDKSVVDHGINIGSAMQMALARDPAIAGFVSDPNLNKYKRNANIAETAKDLSEDMGEWLKHSGITMGHSEASAGVKTAYGFSLFGAEASAFADGKVGIRSQDKEDVNLLTAAYDQNIRRSLAEADEKGLNRKDTESYVGGKIGDFTQDLYDKGRQATGLEYGASAPVGIANNILDKVAGAIIERGDISAGKFDVKK